MFIPCQKCGQQYADSNNWYVCDKCGYRICMSCFGSHSGPGNGYNTGGYKCSQCQTGYLQLQHGVRSSVENTRPASKLDEYLARARGEKQETTSLHTDKTSFDLQPSQSTTYNDRSSNKASDGIILTNTRSIASKYKNTTKQDVQNLIREFIANSSELQGF